MKRILLLPVMLLSLVLAGCGAGTKVGALVDAVTTTITNPVSAVDIYRVKNTYAATLQLMSDYRTYCWSKPYAALVADPIAKPVCRSRRSVVRAMQTAQLKAGSAVRSAETFVQQHPTLNAATAIAAAWDAVKAFQATVPSN